MPRKNRHDEVPEEGMEERKASESPGEKRESHIITPEDIDTLIRERGEYLEMARRARADYDNLQKRMQSQFDAARVESQGQLALDMLGILDDIERAIAHGREGEDYAGLLEGIVLVRGKFAQTLARYEITEIAAEGAPFDPNYHHAVAEGPTDDVEPGTVVAVTQKGYMFGSRLLRPASVVVARSLEEPDRSDP